MGPTTPRTQRRIDREDAELEELARSCARETRRCSEIADELRDELRASTQAIRATTRAERDSLDA